MVRCQIDLDEFVEYAIQDAQGGLAVAVAKIDDADLGDGLNQFGDEVEQTELTEFDWADRELQGTWQTALLLAAIYNNLAVAEWLLIRCADPLKESEEDTPLSVAQRNNHACRACAPVHGATYHNFLHAPNPRCATQWRDGEL
jgi:hypothetical protein